MLSRTGYLFQREGSTRWYIRLQSNVNGERRVVEKSLGTANRQEAEILSLPLIAEHKAKLLAARPHFEAVWVHEFEPGREHVARDGHRVIATDRELIHIKPDGTTRIEPNGGPRQALKVGGRLTLHSLVKAHFEQDRPKLATKDSDDALLEKYLRHRAVTGYKAKEARDTWALFKALVGKRLKDCDRDDGRKLAAHYQSQGLKRDSIRKRLSWLVAAVNFGIAEGLLTGINMFSGVLPKGNDAERRLPFDDNDVKLIKRNLGKLAPADQLLLRLLAATGMRLGEAFQIDKELVEKGCRFVIVGSKTETSLRRVPLPSGFPAIKGQLFQGNPHAASKRLMSVIREAGIMDAAKVVHSFRHRAKDRLRAAGCPDKINDALLGHGKKSVADGYGKGYPVVVLKKWLDEIGF